MSGRSDRCFGTPVGATALLLVLRHTFWCFGTPVGATTLLLCGQACSDRCFGTPAGAMTLLLRGQARPDRCFGIPALCYDTSVLYGIFEYLLCCVLLISYDWSE